MGTYDQRLLIIFAHLQVDDVHVQFADGVVVTSSCYLGLLSGQVFSSKWLRTFVIPGGAVFPIISTVMAHLELYHTVVL